MLPLMMTLREYPRRSDDLRLLGERPASRVDEHFTVDHHCLKGTQGNHAWGSDDFTGTNIERPIVKIAFDDVAVHAAFGQRTRPMRAVVVGYIEVIAEVEYGERQAGSFNLHDTAFGNVARRAEF